MAEQDPHIDYHPFRRKLEHKADQSDEASRKIADAFRATFSSESGRIVLDAILFNAGMGLPSFDPASTHQTAFNEGAKWLATQILVQSGGNVKSHLLNPKNGA